VRLVGYLKRSMLLVLFKTILMMIARAIETCW